MVMVSFVDATLVLEVGETVEETTDSGFSASESTIAVALLADNAASLEQHVKRSHTSQEIHCIARYSNSHVIHRAQLTPTTGLLVSKAC